ncbi:TIGR04222 domain-containing membrane protein [Croceicoccus sediminis]|uniref:TIGR04222 domain-containing membrane protein n=1 Tax=Croceicoccus sediminis TaxID=2571150 RepID=UPI00147846DE|nr:TIGR04222 domain-containing membrane protein [Croceicoccus sediminis]
MNGSNPLDWDATEFLILYVVLIVVAVILRTIIANFVRGEGYCGTLKDADEIAMVSGGRRRFNEAVVARMLATGMLTMVEIGRFAPANRPANPTGAERAVFALGSRIKWKKVNAALCDNARQLEERLVSRGLMMGDGEVWQVRLLQAVPFLFLLGFGWIRVQVGEMRGEAVGNLIASMTIAALIGIALTFKVDRATKSGRAELASLRATNERLRRAPLSQETGMAVALFGTPVLAGTMLSDFHRMRSSDSGGGCGSDGGSGCGGGGCGGCGG